MPFPEFEPDCNKLLFFSRGRGRGHAIPDIEVVRAIQQARSDIQVRFASYGTGARTLREAGYEVIDLNLPEANGIAQTTVVAGRLIGWLQPDLVVSHEEFSALPAAKIFGITTACLLDWFAEPSLFSMQSLAFADSVLFLDRPDLFEEPPSVRGRVRHIGPVLRPLSWATTDRKRAREELGIPPESTLVTVIPGSWTEERSPLLTLVAGAFQQLELPSKHLYWIAGDDFGLVSQYFADRKEVTVADWDWQLDRLLAATDVALTKATRGVTVHAEALGVRTIAISHGQNPMDEHRIRISGAPLFFASELTPSKLTERILAVLEQPSPQPSPCNGACKIVAQELIHLLDR